MIFAYLTIGACIGCSLCLMISIMVECRKLERALRSDDPVVRMVGAYSLFLLEKNIAPRARCDRALEYGANLARTGEIRKALAE